MPEEEPFDKGNYCVPRNFFLNPLTGSFAAG
jgi:hypothetical protein